jgi:hypothetical protein
VGGVIPGVDAIEHRAMPLCVNDGNEQRNQPNQTTHKEHGDSEAPLQTWNLVVSVSIFPSAENAKMLSRYKLMSAVSDLRTVLWRPIVGPTIGTKIPLFFDFPSACFGNAVNHSSHDTSVQGV